MKKGLLSILAGALLVVGCQNYDDQFANLEADINAITAVVAGLSDVTTQISSLSGTVNSLTATVNGLGDEIDTAVADGLADIQADITAIEAAVANVASSEDVEDLQESVDASQLALDELLANSSVFTGSVVVNSVATLGAFHAMGSSLAIVNGGVDIDVNTEMDMVKVQELVNQFLTITGDLSYHAAASTIAEVTFDNLTGVQTLTLEQPGGYVLPELISAAKISLSDKYKSSVDIIDFRKLTSVGSFGTDSTTGGSITFDKATEIHLTSLPYYAPATMSLKGKKGGVIDITALDDVNSVGDQTALSLTLNGPETVAISKLDGKGGSLTFENVENVTVTDYDGTITIKDGVENFTSNNVVAIGSTSTWADIVTVDMTGVVDPNFIASTATPKDYGPDVKFDKLSDLETVTLGGTFALVAVTGNTNLITATVTADVTGSAGIDFDGNTDMETLTLTGSKAAKVLVDGNVALTALTVDTTIQASSATAATKDGTISVTGNTDLATLVISSKDVSSLTITDNTALVSIDGTGLTTLGAGGTTAVPANPSVSIQDNNLSATLATNKTNATGCDDCDTLEVNDLGSFTTTSKMETLAPYLKLVLANAKSTATVYFDTVESTVNAAGTETTAEVTGQVDGTAILVMSAAEAAEGAKAIVTEKRAWLIDNSNRTSRLNTVKLTVDDVDLLYRASTADYGVVTLTGNNSVDIALLKASVSPTRASTLGVKFDVVAKGNSKAPVITFKSTVSSGTNGENYTNLQAAAITAGTATTYLTTYDKVTLTVGTLSVVATITGGNASLTTGDAYTKIATAVALAWNTKYGNTSAASPTNSYWGTATSDSSGAITFAEKASSRGSGGFGDTFGISWNSAAATSAIVSAATGGVLTSTILDWVIGSDDATTDNIAEANLSSGNLIFILEEDTNLISGTNAVMTITLDDVTLLSSTSIELSRSDYSQMAQDGTTPSASGFATSSATNIYPLEARLDVRRREGTVEATTAAVAAVKKTRVHWLVG